MAQIIKNLFLLVLLLGSTACSSTSSTIDYMVVGSGTVKGNELMVGPITFDDSWSKPVGSLACCWQLAGKISTVHDVSFPKKASVYWSDLSKRRIYFTDVMLDQERGAKLARNLPAYRYHTGEVATKIKPYLILGFGEQGEVKVWLSNSAYENEGRVLYEIGSGQADWRPMTER